MTFKTIEQMQDEIEQLRVDYNEAFIDGSNTERAKIALWFRRSRWYSTADAIEAGEHLK